MPVHQSLCPFTSWLSPRRRRLLALSRVPSDSLPFACQFPLRNDEFPQFASSALLLLSSAGVSRVILCRIYEFEPSIPVPAPSCKLFYSITGNMKNEIVNSTLPIPSGILSRTIHIYSFIHSCYLYLNPDSSGRSFYE